MKRFAKLLLVTFGFGAFGFAMSLVPQKTATGAAGAPVTVMNTPLPVAGTVGATQSGAWNVGISGTPSVNVATLPPITGNVNATITGTPSVNVNFPSSIGVSGNVQVINSPGMGPSDEPEPTALLTRDETNPAFEPFVENLCSPSGCDFPGKDSSYTVPSRAPDGNSITRVVVEEVSGDCGTFNGQTTEVEVRVSGTFIDIRIPLTHAADFTSNTASLEVFGRTTRMYLSPGNTITLAPGATTSGTGTFCDATLEGYFVVAPVPLIP